MTLRVIPLPASSEHYDLSLAALGYESRSVHAATQHSARTRHFLVYDGQASKIFKKNVEAARALDGSRLAASEPLHLFNGQISQVLGQVSTGQRIAIDISSFDRRRLAIVLDQVLQTSRDFDEMTVDILYSPADYSPPPAHLSSSPLEAAPIGDSFRGHLRKTSLPLTAVFGLGYEPQRAIGAFELLEPSRAWAFWPNSDDERYEKSLRHANRLLLDVFSPQDVLTYPVLSPTETYYRLESLVSGLTPTSRVVLVPMGPKIFAACCILLGLDQSPERPAVWRIGTSGMSEPFDSRPRGEIVGIRLQLGRAFAVERDRR